jgi:hypothetical protein
MSIEDYVRTVKVEEHVNNEDCRAEVDDMDEY